MLIDVSWSQDGTFSPSTGLNSNDFVIQFLIFIITTNLFTL